MNLWFCANIGIFQKLCRKKVRKKFEKKDFLTRKWFRNSFLDCFKITFTWSLLRNESKILKIRRFWHFKLKQIANITSSVLQSVKLSDFDCISLHLIVRSDRNVCIGSSSFSWKIVGRDRDKNCYLSKIYFYELFHHHYHENTVFSGIRVKNAQLFVIDLLDGQL